LIPQEWPVAPEYNIKPISIILFVPANADHLIWPCLVNAIKASRVGSGHAGSSARSGVEMLMINIIKMQRMAAK